MTDNKLLKAQDKLDTKSTASAATFSGELQAPVCSFLFGAGAEMAYGMPSGIEFAKAIFKQNINPAFQDDFKALGKKQQKLKTKEAKEGYL